MEKLDFTLLTMGEGTPIAHSKNLLNVIKRYKPMVAPTDLAVIQGTKKSGRSRTSGGDLACLSWFSTPTPSGIMQCTYFNESLSPYFWAAPYARFPSVRPVLRPSESSKIVPYFEKTEKGIHVVEFGEYPQTAADMKTRLKLEELFQSKLLNTTGRKYTFDAETEKEIAFRPVPYAEYEYKGQRYIRMEGHSRDENSRLSTLERVHTGEPFWIRVEPIEWLVDETGTWVSKKALFSGIQFDNRAKFFARTGSAHLSKGKDDDYVFEKTFMKYYLDNYFANEIEGFGPHRRERIRDITISKHSLRTQEILRRLGEQNIR